MLQRRLPFSSPADHPAAEKQPAPPGLMNAAFFKNRRRHFLSLLMGFPSALPSCVLNRQRFLSVPDPAETGVHHSVSHKCYFISFFLLQSILQNPIFAFRRNKFHQKCNTGDGSLCLRWVYVVLNYVLGDVYVKNCTAAECNRVLSCDLAGNQPATHF